MSDTGRTNASYRFVVRGELDDRFASVFEGMRIERQAKTTVLIGTVVDQSHLFGLLERIQELGIELVSVEPETPAPSSGTVSTANGFNALLDEERHRHWRR